MEVSYLANGVGESKPIQFVGNIAYRTGFSAKVGIAPRSKKQSVGNITYSALEGSLGEVSHLTVSLSS